ncbi:MAG: AraC family transcriptional regulator [Bacteroidota bacterium]
MRRLRQFETLVISDFEEEVYHLPKHNHTYYEIIYIYKGCGLHHLNENILPYSTGDLFLLAPEDQHYFDIKKSTRFIFIKFTDNYFNSKKHISPDEFLMRAPENLMRNKVLKETKLKLEEPCKTILKNTVENINAYNSRKDVAASPIIFYQVLSILGLVKEAIGKMEMPAGYGYPNKEQLISYIHQHIYSPQKIQIKQIALHFNIASTYFSAYFRRNFGLSYRDYINQSRTKLIEKRVVNGHLTLKQIAGEFGFTDESHLSHFFKKKLLVNASAYRASAKEV